MGFKTTSTKRNRAAFTLVEMIVATGVGAILFAGVMGMFWFANRSFASLTNYLDLDQKTQATLDKMSREIRQVNMLTDFSPTNLTFQNYDGSTLQYVYNPNAQTLTRIHAGISTTTLLTGCDSLQFSIFQRAPSSNDFQPYPTTVIADTKVIQLTWNCYRTILGGKVNTESMQSAKVVIRKK
jgi:prepilin-type N-terminal cleavage/methylation domain-containing protein